MTREENPFQKGELVKETEWSRTYKSPAPERVFHCESKLLKGEIRLSADYVISNWPKWDESEQLDFANSFYPRRDSYIDEKRIIEFLMRRGIGTKDPEAIWSTLPLKLILLPERKKALHFLCERIRGKGHQGIKSNYYQGLGWLGDRAAIPILEQSLERLLANKNLWRKDKFTNWIASDCLSCLDALKKINPKERHRYADIARRFLKHPNFMVRSNAWHFEESNGVLQLASIKEQLTQRRALLQGHFLLSSGLHSNQYVQCARLLQDTLFAEYLGRAAASLWAHPQPDLIVSPAMGGLIIGHEVAKAFWCPFIFTERVDGKMALRRGFSIEKGQKAIVVEDVLTTGKSSREVMEVVKNSGGEVLAVLSIINRGVKAKSLGVPVESLVEVDLITYAPEACPLCKKGKPLVKPGSRPQPK